MTCGPPEQIGVLALGREQHTTIRGDDFHRHDVVPGRLLLFCVIDRESGFGAISAVDGNDDLSARSNLVMTDKQ